MAALPGGSWADWQRECEVEAKDVTLDAGAGALLSKLSGRATFQELQLQCPTVSIDDDTIYLLYSRTTEPKDNLELEVAVDVRNKALRGAAKLDVQRLFVFMPKYFASDICRYLSNSTAGTSEELNKPTEKEAAKLNEMLRVNQLRCGCSPKKLVAAEATDDQA